MGNGFPTNTSKRRQHMYMISPPYRPSGGALLIPHEISSPLRTSWEEAPMNQEECHMAFFALGALTSCITTSDQLFSTAVQHRRWGG